MTFFFLEKLCYMYKKQYTCANIYENDGNNIRGEFHICTFY